MPMPKPEKRERKEKFIVRCMSDEIMRKDFPDTQQRYAICIKQWSAEATLTDDESTT